MKMTKKELRRKVAFVIMAGIVGVSLYFPTIFLALSMITLISTMIYAIKNN